jgi:ABC-type branched-subunit amino acid transport system substrate-binding protein
MARSRRRPVVAPCLLAALALLAAGCGSSGTVEGGNDTYSATTLTVYTDLPLLGPDAALMTSIVNGEELALKDAGGHVGRLHVSIEELDDAADPAVTAPGIPSPLSTDTDQTEHSAYLASSDLSTAAYIGDFDSASSAPALELNNQNDILQISPASDYVGFTDSSRFDVKGDPGIFYPTTGPRTFARLVPSDLEEATATVAYMRSLGVRRLDVLSDTSTYDSVIAREVAADAPGAGIAIVGNHAGIDTASNGAPGDYAKLAAAVAAERPDAILFGGSPDAGAQALFRELHAKLPAAKLFAPSALAMPSFLGGLGAAAGATYVTSPVLEPDQYPAAAQTVFSQYRRDFPGVAPTGYSLYGYEAMEDVLRAIARAKRQAAKRSALLAAFHSLGEIHGVIGNYTINGAGDTSLDRFDGYRVGSGGTLVLVRAIS